MCGIAGIVGTLANQHNLDAMERSLVHRGPDDGSIWFDDFDLIGFCHRRLSIIDLSPAGRQPMSTADYRFTIVFNGEIYNYEELRDELIAQGTSFRGHSDTEVLLELFAKHGVKAINQLAGMFAFAIWDREEKKLTIARDQLGIKPLYLLATDTSFAFASEIRSLMKLSEQNCSLDGNALRGYLSSGSVPEPTSLVSGVRMLPAGHYLEWTDASQIEVRYWQPKFRTQASYTIENVSWEHSVSKVRNALQETIRRHFVSDVPVGIFLSGGIDSAALVSLARQSGIEKIKTFSIGFAEREFDESSIASRTASFYKTEHHEWQMTATDGQDLFGKYLQSMDQPSVDGFNTFCVSKFAHDNGMKVVLSGLGGDEIFGSYPSFKRIPNLMFLHRSLGPFRNLASAITKRFFPSGPKSRLTSFLKSHGTVEDAYGAMRGIFTDGQVKEVVQSIKSRGYTITNHEEAEIDSNQQLRSDWHLQDQISFLELTRYMRNQLLRDSDVMSMAWGLELRVPFVDARFVDVMGSIPTEHRLAGGKRLLVEAVGDLPAFLHNQPKRGFRFPFDVWISQNKEWSEKMKAVERIANIPNMSWYQKWMLFSLNHFLANEAFQ